MALADAGRGRVITGAEVAFGAMLTSTYEHQDYGGDDHDEHEGDKHL